MEDQSMEETYMVHTLVKHLFFDRMFPILPIESSLETYTEVEHDIMFLSCRSVILNVAISQDLAPIIEQSLDLIDLILRSKKITSPNVPKEAVESICVVLRLLSDIMEFYWDNYENQQGKTVSSEIKENERIIDIGIEKQNNLFSGTIVGYSTHRPNFHSMRPEPLPPHLATRLISSCSKVKFSHLTHKVLSNISKNSIHYTSLTQDDMMPNHHYFESHQSSFGLEDKIDLTIDYIQRFVSASNPTEFSHYVRLHVIEASLHSTCSWSEIVVHFDLFGCIYISKKSLIKFLELVKLFMSTSKRSIFNCLLLYFASKSLMYWLMARPIEYKEIFNNFQKLSNLESHQKERGPKLNESDKKMKTLLNIIVALFDEIYSTFNVIGMLSTSSQSSNIISSTAINLHAINTTSSNSPTLSNHSKDVASTISSLKSTASAPSLVQSQESSKLISNPVLPTLPPNKYSITGNLSFEMAQQLSQNATSPIYNIDEQVIIKGMPVNIDPFFEMDQSISSNVETNSTQYESETFHLKNVLDLYTSFDDNESLINTSILRFLSILVLLDPCIFLELNSTQFKNIDSAGLAFPARENEKEKEKSLSMKHITHGLKKLTSITPHKVSKSSKFFTLLIKVYSGSHSASESSILDSFKALLSFYTVASAVSLIDKELPASIFAKRLIDSFGINLQIGTNWKSAPLPHISQCLKQNNSIIPHFQLEYFSASLQLSTDDFLQHLNLKEVAASMNTKKLVLYTEGLRVFFHLPCYEKLKRETSIKTADFFKTLFGNVSDLLLSDFPSFENEKVSDVVEDIINGNILEKFRSSYLVTHSSPTSITSNLSVSPSMHDSPDVTSPISNDGQWIHHPIGLTTTNSSAISDVSTPNVSNISDLSCTNLISPRARRISGTSGILKRGDLLNNQDDYDRTTGYFAPNMANHVSSTTPIQTSSTRTLRAPLRQSHQRKLNEEGISKILKQTIAGNSDIIKSGVDANVDDARRIMLNIFSIFKRTTNYFMVSLDEKVNSESVNEDFKQIIKPIFIAIIDHDSILQLTARSFMNVLISYMSEVEKLTPTRILTKFYSFCSYSVTLFASALFDLNLPNNKREIILDIVAKLLQVRCNLGKISEQTGNLDQLKESEMKSFGALVGTLSRGLFVSLYTNKGSTQKLLTTVYSGYYHTLLFYRENIGDLDKWHGNLDFVKAMSKDNYVSSGSVAFQRRLRTNILKHVTNTNEMLLDSLHIIFKRWLRISKMKSLSAEDLADFRSFAGIIASISGVMLTINYDTPIKFTNLPEAKHEITKEINYFIGKQCQWLNNQDLLTRENSRDILSLELHPLSFQLLFHNLKLKIDEIKSVDLSEDNQEFYFILLEQIIIIIRTILKRNDDENVMVLFSLDIVNFIDQLVDIVSKIPRKSLRYYKAIIQLSKMFRAMKDSEHNLGLAGHFQLKNKWLKLVTKWFKSSISKEFEFTNLSKPHREMDLKRRDLDLLYLDTSIESSKAIAYLTSELPLEVPPAFSEEEMSRSAGLIFRNYFGILLKGIERATDFNKFPPSLKHKVSILNENLITSLTNISNSNVEPALQYTLPMGFSENKDIRISFLKVFINVVKNYPDRKAKNKRISVEATDELLNYVIQYPHLISQATKSCTSNEIDEFTMGLVGAFETKNAAHIVVTQLIKDEIQNSTRYVDILRRNSVATRVLSLYSRSKGNDYLIKTLGPVLEEMIENKEYFEVEKQKSDNTDSEKQVTLFEKYMKRLVESIQQSADEFPRELLLVCQTIYKEVKVKFPEDALIAVGSFVFLRFLCPALVSPETENITAVTHTKEKRSLIQLAKIIQNMANGSENLVKWPLLEAKTSFLEDCNKKIFEYLEKLSRTDRVINIQTFKVNAPSSLDLNFFHRFLYVNELKIRKGNLEELKSFAHLKFLRETIMLVDRVLKIWGQPVWEYRNEIPSFVKENMDKYPQLYEFMSRYAFKRISDFDTKEPFVHESMSADGFPILTLTFKRFSSMGIDVDCVIYRTLQVYSRIWSTKHYLVLDCTEFRREEIDVSKLTTLFLNLVPTEAYLNCIGYYYINVTEAFMESWLEVINTDNPYVYHKVPIFFVNSLSDQKIVDSIGLTPETITILEDIRVSLHDISIFDEKTNKFTPISMRLGNKYFQVSQKEGKEYFFDGFEKSFYLKFNNVYSMLQVTDVSVSFTKNIPTEFMVRFNDGQSLIFSSPKYLEIVKMFSYALAKIEDNLDYNATSSLSNIRNKKYFDNEKETLAHILLIVLVGLFNKDDIVKNISYNLLATTQEAFNLDFGRRCRATPEMYVPEDCTTFLRQLSKSVSEANPELTPHMFKLIVDALENGIIPSEYIPQSVCCLSYWIPNLYKYVYLSNEEEGPEALSYLIRVLIRLTILEPHFTSVYLQQIWYILALDDKLTKVIVEEVVGHALERDSENRDWTKVLPLLTGLSTVDIACHIIQRLLKIIDSFLPSLKMEVSTHSWSELAILVKISIPLFFESPLLAQMYLPEVLFIVSLLLDNGPKEIRSHFHELLMNVCHSLVINESLSEINRKSLDDVCSIFSRQKQKFIFGFSQDKGSVLQNFSVTSFVSKFNTLEHFTTNIMFTMENADVAESAHWKTRYKKYLMDSIFNRDSFLSARAMMILGIMGKSSTSEMLCKNLLTESMKVISNPHVGDEEVFLYISHIFTYSKIVEGLPPNLYLMKQLFWFAACVVESPHPIVFEGGLLFLSNCLKRLYMYKFESCQGSMALGPMLIQARKFAEPLLLELEGFGGIAWTQDSFSEVLISIIIRGLAIPFVKPTAIDCLEQFFRNAYYEHRIHPESDDYLSYMFLLLLLSSPDEFADILNAVEYEEGMLSLDESNKLPVDLMNWLSSDGCYSNIALYQCAVLFGSTASDEQTKLRFAMIMKHLLKTNPVCVFRFYTITRNELRRLSTLEHNSKNVTIPFEVITLLVKHPEFDNLHEYTKSSLETLKKLGLSSVSTIKSFNQNDSDILMGIQEAPKLVYERKRLLTMILARIVCSE